MNILQLPLSSIQVPANRQRVEVEGEALAALAESILANGLLHPVVVRAQGDAYFLVAGGRRLSALSNLAFMDQGYKCGDVPVPAGFIAAISLGELSPLAAEEAELEENIRRVDLTWQERAHATARLAAFRKTQAFHAGQQSPSIEDIATEVRGNAKGSAHEDTRKEIILAAAMDNPEVKKAATLQDAWKAHLRGEDAQRNKDLAAQIGPTFGKHSHTLIQADCTKWIEEQASEQFDVILTDPPYGMGADSFGDAGGRLQAQTHGYEDSPEAWKHIIGELGAEWCRVAKPQAHLYICCDIDGFHWARDWLSRVGWKVHRTPLINYKLDGSRVPWPQHGPQRKWEMVLYATKGNKPVTRIYSDVIETKGDENLAHGAQKPVALFKNLLMRSVRPGDTVLDCFGGTGTTILAAHELLCKATCLELDPTYYGVALKRLQGLV